MSKGWTDVLRPAVAEKVKTLYAKLIDPSEKRKENLPDDFIRGEIASLKWILEWPEKEMQAAARALKEAEERAKLEEVTNG